MATPTVVATSFGCLLLCAGVLGVAPGCADSEPFPDVEGPGATEGPAPVALPKGGHVIDEYVLHVSPRSRTTKLLHLAPGVSSRPGFKPQSVDAINVVQDNVAGSGPAGSIELNTTNVTFGATCPGGKAASFCGTVVLGSFYTRTLNNVFAQVTSITDVNGVDLSGHSGINSDSPPSWLADSGLGLWQYTATSATTAGVIGTSPNNFGTRIWSFDNPDGADTYITLRVVATLSYKDYTRTGPTTGTFINPCATHNDNTSNGADIALTLPFGFTFYNIQATTSSIFNRNGVLTVGGAAPPSAVDVTEVTSVNLPENVMTPHVSASPGIYPFWDRLNYNASQSAICHTTVGAAPNRQFVFAWRNMKGFNNATNRLNVSFNVILTEGTDTIDMVYGIMAGATTPANDETTFATAPTTITNVQRAQGKKAAVGVQGPNGSVNITTPAVAALGATILAANTAYRYTPIP
jgi:hypothetical protein